MYSNNKWVCKFVHFVFFTLICNFVLAQKANMVSGKEIVSKVYTVLNNLKNIQYSHSRIVDVKSELVYSTYEGEMSMLFTPKSKIGVTYIFKDSKEGLTVYNGKDEYYANAKDNKAKKTENISIEDLGSKSFLNPSINTIKNNFEWLQNTNKYKLTLSDTLIEEKKYCNIYFQFKGKDFSTINNKLDEIDSNIIIYYTIVVEAATFLPYKIIRKYSLNTEDNIITTFTKIKINANNIGEFTFTPNDFVQKKPITKKVKIKNANWTLPVLNSNTNISKQDLKGNVVLLEFFFIGCSPCKKDIPWLAALQNKYKGKGFKLYSVNSIDSKELITKYKQKNRIINYDILYDANQLLHAYNIHEYPKIILLNKKGDIIYNGDLNKKIISNLIDKNL